MKVKITNIKWDTDGHIIPRLPLEVTQEFPFTTEEGLDWFLSDWLSDTYGFCHFGFHYKIVD